MPLFVFFISLLIVAQHVSGNHVPIPTQGYNITQSSAPDGCPKHVEQLLEGK